MLVKRTSLVVLALLVAGLAGAAYSPFASADPAGPARPHMSAEALYQRALDWLARNTVDTRRQALRALEQATLLDPANAEYELTLARTYYACGFLRNARLRFERVARLRPEDAGGHEGLGLVWRRDWLKYLDRSSLDLAVKQFSSAASLDPGNAGVSLVLVPLLLEQGRLEEAVGVAFRAAKSEPDRPEAHLAVAGVLQRNGMLHEADSIFRATIPRLRRNVRERFEDIGPLATEQDTAVLHRLPRTEQAAFVARFWKRLDPDLSTPENEAQLEYWARVTQAYFLFFDPRRDAWDERGEVYARYGPPAGMEYTAVSNRPGLVWSYPELGMTVVMEDRLLSEFYLLPVSSFVDMDPVPDPDSLARSGNALATPGGRGVFHLLPPGMRPLPVEGLVTRFEGVSGPRLLAQLEVPGGPADSVWAEWVVLDSAGAEQARGARPLSPSACAVTSRRAGDFTATLAPGSYIVGVTARGGDGRLGILRKRVRLAPPGSTLALSDVVVACGRPEVGRGAPVHIEPNPSARVAGAGPLTAYFEIYHLTPGPGSLARFEYVYSVRAGGKDTRFWLQKLLAPAPGPLISVSHEEQNLGTLRRQFITVPVASLAPGRYRLEVKVRDLATHDEVVKQVEFTKSG
jgi:GWxTD domain-containing protein